MDETCDRNGKPIKQGDRVVLTCLVEYARNGVLALVPEVYDTFDMKPRFTVRSQSEALELAPEAATDGS